jgi:RNA polymerase sigma-70 factor (ECF subfamily)
MNKLLDNKTLTAFASRDPHAFKVVFDLYYTELRYFTERVISDPEMAKDITMETFLKLFKRSEQFNTPENIKAFLFITARNNCFDYLRHKKRVQARQKDLQLEMIARLSDDHDFENGQIEAAVVAKIYEAIEELPEACRNVFKMLYCQGLEQAEVASRLNLSISTVRSHKSRAIKLLRAGLPTNGLQLLFLVSLSHLTPLLPEQA